jgi:hypothetical protein
LNGIARVWQQPTAPSIRAVAALSNRNVSMLVDLARQGDLRFDCLVSAEMTRV